MNALARNLTPVDRLDYPSLILANEAAPRLELSQGHLARLCRGELAEQGFAILATPPDGGQKQWFIKRAYDDRLSNGAPPDPNVEPDLSRYSEKQRTQAMIRLACVMALRDARQNRPGKMCDWMYELIQQLSDKFKLNALAERTLYKWDARYQRPADLVKLIDLRGGDRKSEDDPAAWKAFRDLYLHENQPSLKQCWREVARMARENAWKWCGLRSCEVQLDRRIPIETQMFHREPALWRQQMAPFIKQDPESWRAGELYIGDHKQLDLICTWNDSKIRPWLTTWMDWRTRKIVGWTLSDVPNSTTILGALRHALKDESNFGGPRCVWIDNGKDYDAWLFHGQTKQQRREKIKPAIDEPRTFGIFYMLKIEAHFATPYNPNGKARLERWFRTLESFCRTFATYTGDGPDTRPERLNEILKNPRSIPSFKMILDRIADHIVGYNEGADHAKDDLVDGGERISPAEAMARWCETRRVHSAGSLDLLMAHWHKPVPVGRNGITITLQGQALHFGQFSADLSPFKARSKEDRRPVYVSYDPHDLTSIRVFDEQWKYVCEAPMNDVGGAHGTEIAMEHISELNRRKTRHANAKKHIAELAITSALTNEEHAAEIAASTAAKRNREPLPMQIVATPFDGQAEQIERQELRQAVGAETMPPPRRASILDKLMRQNPRPAPPASAPIARMSALDKVTATRLREANHG